MTLINISQLEVGHELQKDALGANGRLLLKAGSTIKEKHLDVFRTWGVVEVDIIGDEPPQDESNIDFSALPTEIKDQITQKLEHQFRHCNLQNPLIHELVSYQKVRLIKTHLEGEKTPA